MSRSGRIVREFADGRYEFFLNLDGLDELDEKTGVGPGTLLKRIAAGDFRPRDLREVIRIALIRGGQVKPIPALKLVERYCDPPNPLFDSLDLAIAILQAALYAPTPKVKKKQSAVDEQLPTTDSTSTLSTETVQ